MAREPLILALANPEPEILPEVAKAVRPDAIIATGRSDYPNQVNNVLCFPFIFRGALDVGATTITEAMKLACVRAHRRAGARRAVRHRRAGLRRRDAALRPRIPDPQAVRSAPDRDRAPAVAKAAMDSGVATRPIADFDAYREQLSQFVYHSGLIMKPVFAARQARRRSASSTPRARTSACCAPCRSSSTKGSREPILIGRPEVIAARIEQLRAAPRAPARDFELVNINSDPRYRDCWQLYYQLMGRNGVSPEDAKEAVLRKPYADRRAAAAAGRRATRMLCGTVGKYHDAPAPRRRRHRPRAGRAGVRGDERPAAARPHAVHLRHLRQPRPDAPSSWPRSRCWPPRRCAASASRPRSRCCRIRTSAATTRRRRARCARRARLLARARARTRGRRRDARRRGAVRGDPQPRASRTRR